MIRKIAAFAVFIFSSALIADAQVTPTIIARSQGSDASRKLVGVANKTHMYTDSWYLNASAMPEYGQTFRANELAKCLFGDDLNCNTIKIQGSNVADRDPKAWLADYFYLAPDFDGTISFTPRIKNFLVDLDVYVGLDSWAEGLYFRAHGPLAWSNWNLNFCESCDVETTNSFRPGYFTPDTLQNNQLLQSFGEYGAGDSPLNTSGTAGQPELGVAFNGLKFAKITPCSRSRTGFADLRLELGYDMLRSERGHFGLNVQVAAPTGGKRRAEFAFDSVIGNGNHWEAGGGLTAHYIFWKCQDEDKHWGFYVDANITHVISAKEQRTFDLCARPNSRYMLAEKLGTPVTFLLADTDVDDAAGAVAPIAQFQGEYTPVANLTSLNVNVSIGFQADIAAMLNFTSNHWSFDLGYNFWARSCEKISKPQPCDDQCCPNLCADENTWALKGDAAVFGYVRAPGSGDTSTNTPIALSATQCGATIHNGTNTSVESTTGTCLGTNTLQNCGVDNPAFAFIQGENAGVGDRVNLQHTAGTTTDGDAIKTSLQPKFINCCDINFQETKGLSNKVFAHIGHTWDVECWNPYVGVGASAEWGKTEGCPKDCAPTIDCDTPCDNNSCATTCCSPCINCAVSQWAVWIKGGVTFN